jgi:hypothetical protein
LIPEDNFGKLSIVEAAVLVFIVLGEQLLEFLAREVHTHLLSSPLKQREVHGTFVFQVEELKHLDQASLFRHLSV